MQGTDTVVGGQVDPPPMGQQYGPQYNWHMFRTAVAGFICYPFCGLFGIIYAILSYIDFENKKMDKYEERKRCSLGWSITAVVLGSLFWLILIAVLGGLSAAVSTVASVGNQGYGYRGTSYRRPYY